MIRTYHSILTLTATMTATCNAGALVGFDDAPITADDQPVKGVAQVPATEVGLDIGLTAIGFETCKAVGVVTKGAPLVSAAAGGVKVAGVDPDNVFATAMTDAADGELVTFLIR
jgi:hypothetical protein